MENLLPYEISTYLCQYLGLPLSLHKVTRQEFQPFLEQIADQLLNWKVDLPTRAGREVQVQHVLTGTTIYLAMAIDIPQWSLYAIDKIRKRFLWRGQKKVRGGHRLVAWGKVGMSASETWRIWYL